MRPTLGYRPYSAIGISLVLAISMAFPAVAQQSHPATPPEESRPGESTPREITGHQLLSYFVGDWRTETRMWPGDGGEPSFSAGTSRIVRTLGGKFVMEIFHGAVAAEEYEEIGLLGYDTQRGRFTAVWANNLETQVSTARGSFDPRSRTFVFIGERDSPSGRLGLPRKYVYRLLSQDRFVFELLEPTAGEDTKRVEITYTRRSIEPSPSGD